MQKCTKNISSVDADEKVKPFNWAKSDFRKLQKGSLKYICISSFCFSVKLILNPQATAMRSNTSLVAAAPLTTRFSLSHGSPTVSGQIPAL